MKKLLTNIAIVTASVGLVTSCSTNTQSQNTGIGAVSGAVVGGVAAGVLGGNPVAIGLSAVAGALIGGYIGHSMDSTDNKTVATTMNNNATNMPTHWKNPKTGVVYTIIPTSDMMTIKGNPNCRTYKAIAKSHGKKHVTTGAMCRQANGTWMRMK